MQRGHTQTRSKPSTVKRRIEPTLEADDDLYGDGTIRFDGIIEIVAEENDGDDPYNRTGRFQQIIR